MAQGIPYGVGLILSLRGSLSSAFNRPVILNTKPHNPGGEFAVSLTESDKFAQTNEGSEQLVCEIRDADSQPSGFYFGFAATFELFDLGGREEGERRATPHKYMLQHASLQVFHDIGELLPLFRAEWDQKAASDTKSDHAQPHWHFVQRPERIERIVRMLISPPTEFAPEEESELFAGYADSGKFHFAMSPLWDKNKESSHKQLFESADFQKWFASLTKYVAGQIAYLVKKAPPAVAKEFVPES